MDEVWAKGEAYEQFMGRWSRVLAPLFLDWLDAPDGLRWAEVGCGSGALTAAIVDRCAPRSVLATDPSAAQVEAAARRVQDPRVSFGVGGAGSLPSGSFDMVVSGLVLNFIPNPVAAVSAMRWSAPRGAVAAYVWDYAVGMQLLRIFWDVACSLDPSATHLHEGHRFVWASPGEVAEVLTRGGLHHVAATELTVATVFESFAAFWSPFLGGQGPAPGYVATLETAPRERLRAALEEALPTGPDGTISLTARAWAARGTSAQVSRVEH